MTTRYSPLIYDYAEAPQEGTDAQGVWWLEQALWMCLVFSASGALVAFERFGSPTRLVWILADSVAVLACIRSWALYLTVLMRIWPLLLWPALAILSASWSLAPFVSAYHGVQLFMTLLVGVVMMQRLTLFGVMKVVFWALTLAAVISFLAVMLRVRDSIGPVGEWIGVYTHKNSLGLTMSVLYFTAFSLFLAGWRRVLCAAVGVFAAGLVVASRSGTSILAVAAITVIGSFLATRRVGVVSSVLLASTTVAIAALVAILISTTNADLVELTLNALGKDATLTGRTVLWSLGWKAFLEHPILGLGFKGYWEAPVFPDREYLQYVSQQALWLFHNNYLEVAVGLGLVGFALFTLTLLWILFRAFRTYFITPDAEFLWCVLLLVHACIIMSSENPLFFNHSLLQALLAAIASGLTSYKSGQPRLAAPARFDRSRFA